MPITWKQNIICLRIIDKNLILGILIGTQKLKIIIFAQNKFIH